MPASFYSPTSRQVRLHLAVAGGLTIQLPPKSAAVISEIYLLKPRITLSAKTADAGLSLFKKTLQIVATNNISHNNKIFLHLRHSRQLWRELIVAHCH